MRSTNEILNLLRQLAQASDSEQAIKLFLKRLRVLFAPGSFKYSRVEPEGAGLSWPLVTSTANYGYVVAEAPVVPLDAEERALLDHVMELFAVLLERMEFARKIKEGADHEVELRASEARFRSYFDLPLYGIAITSPEKQWVNVNRRICEMLGYAEEELLSTTWVELTHPDDLALDLEKFEKLTAGQIEQYQIEKRFIRKDQEVIYTKLAVGCVRREDGAVSYVVALLEDVTESKRVEAELQKMDKLNSVGLLAGGIAHDFNNILLGVFGNIELAKEELDKEHASYLLLEEAEKSMNRAVRLTKQLLTFATGGIPVKGDIALGTLVEDVAHFDLSGSNIRLICRQAENLWAVKADKGQIQQVISNLVINARQAMPAGGCLYINLENVELKEGSRVNLRPGRYVKIIVRDEGVGIAPEMLDKIFDPFFTTKKAGSGLGLATAWSIIKNHGGYVRVESAVARGTTFTVYVPATELLLPAIAMTTSVSCAQPRAIKILVMDDEEVICKLVEKMLKCDGYTVMSAPGGREALELYQQAMAMGAPFDAVIMDLTIPGGIGGVAALQALVRIDPAIKAIVSSGYAEDPVMANPTAYGFKCTIEKPYTQSTLRAVVAKVLNDK